MPRPLASGRPGTWVIPPTWEADHRPSVEGTLTGKVGLRKPGVTQTWNGESQQMESVPHEPYAEPLARIQALAAAARQVIAAGDREVVADYLVAVPAPIVAEHGDLVDCTDTGDPALDGHTLEVVQVVRGTERFERDLFCVMSS